MRSGYDELAPDGSSIRHLLRSAKASMVYCTLPAGAVSRAVQHATVEEVWFCQRGSGQVWRRAEADEAIVEVSVGCALNIPAGTAFQFRNTGHDELAFVIVTMPPWPGEQEAAMVAGIWP